MKEIKKRPASEGAQGNYTDLVGVDFAASATKIVRLKKSKDEVSLAGIELRPGIDFSKPSGRMALPRSLVANYSCLAYSAPGAIVRVVNTPLPTDETTLSDTKVRELLNAKEDFRVATRLLRRGQGRQDSSFLVAAMPADDIAYLLNMFPAGPPAPASVEVSGLSFISAFLYNRGSEIGTEPICLIEAGDGSCHFAFLCKKEVMLVGRFDAGDRRMRSKVCADLGVDEELANTIMADSSINISTVLLDVMAPFIKQLSISKDFIERHQSSQVSKIYVSGGVSLLPQWSDIVGQYLHAEVVHWSPFEKILRSSDLLTEEMAVQAPRFAAAVGAAIGGFESL